MTDERRSRSDSAATGSDIEVHGADNLALEDDSTPAPTEKPAERSSRFGSLHTRTYEMELLFSGAVVFGLLRLPPLLDDAFMMAVAQTAGGMRFVAAQLYTYLALMTYALLGSFLIHLAMRAMWIGLVGLESVYPDGVRWDSLNIGPYGKAWAKERLPSLSAQVEKVDDLCSLIFPLAFVLVLNFVYSLVLIAVSGLVAAAASELLLSGEYAMPTFWGVLIVILLLLTVVPLADKHIGPRLAPDRLPGRMLRRLVGFVSAILPTRLVGVVMLTLQSNQGTKRITGLILASMTVLGLIVLGGMSFRGGILRVDSGSYFQGEYSSEAVDPRYYRSLEPTGRHTLRMPAIDSDIVTAPYLKLFLPYYPGRHNEMLAEACPDLEPFTSGVGFGRGEWVEPGSVRKAIGCFEGLWEVSLDGEALTGLRFDFARDPLADVSGLASYLPTTGLEPGRHVLTVIAPPRPDDDPESPYRTHVIPFWK